MSASRDTDDDALIREERRKMYLASEREREVKELRELLGTYGGRAYVWRWLCEMGAFHTGFHGENTHLTAFAAGKRDVALAIINEMLTVAADFYNIMRDEAAAREERRLAFER